MRRAPASAGTPVTYAAAPRRTPLETDTKTPQAVPPHMQLIQMSMAYWVSRILFVAARLELADRLAAGPRSAPELAAETGTNARALHRLMRTLASLGVFTERDGGKFALTP